MASSCVDQASVPSDDFLCVVCAEVYKKPTLLHCMHTFCGGCIDELVQVQHDGTKTVSCPNCRFVTKVCVNEKGDEMGLSQSQKKSWIPPPHLLASFRRFDPTLKIKREM